jgi:hypothetical protein
VRTPSFDQLHSLLQRCCLARSQEEKKMIGHYDKFM